MAESRAPMIGVFRGGDPSVLVSTRPLRVRMGHHPVQPTSHVAKCRAPAIVVRGEVTTGALLPIFRLDNIARQSNTATKCPGALGLPAKFKA